MDNNLETAVDSLSKQTKKIDIAAFYTHGDIDRAKQMVAGVYKDLYVLKMIFSTPSASGAAIIFFNHPYSSVTDTSAIISQSYNIKDMKTSTDWKAFEEIILSHITSGEYDGVMSSQMKERIMSYFSVQLESESKAQELKKLIQSNDQIALNHLFQKFVQDRLGFSNINASVDYERTTSLDMELNSRTSRKIDLSQFQKKEEKEKGPKIGLDEEDNPLEGKEIKLIRSGGLMLAPIKGKDISLIRVGDRIKICMADRHPKAVSVARAFNAYVEGKILPIGGRIVSIKKKAKSGYEIYAIVAKGIYIKIDEEEENIKIAMDQVESAASRDESSKTYWPVILILIIIMVVVLVAALFILL